MSSIPIPLYIPNLICYMRIILAYIGYHCFMNEDYPNDYAFWIWILSAALDLFDGILARKLNQCSSLGILLDIAADNILRCCLWLAAATASTHNGLLASIIVSLEWFTMVCTQLHASQGNGNHWKDTRENDPKLLKLIFANNFKTSIGALCVYGLFGLPFVLIFEGHLNQNYFYHPVLKYLAYVGRLTTMIAEIWLCKGYLSFVIEQDYETKKKQMKN